MSVHSEWCDRMNGGPECNCESSNPRFQDMSKREWQIRTRCSGEHVDVSAVDVLYLLGVIDTIRADRNRLRNKANAADAEPESKKPHAGGNTEGTSESKETAPPGMFPIIEQQVAELKAAGWVNKGTMWKQPKGGLYRGPHGAWLVLKAKAQP